MVRIDFVLLEARFMSKQIVLKLVGFLSVVNSVGLHVSLRISVVKTTDQMIHADLYINIYKLLIHILKQN